MRNLIAIVASAAISLAASTALAEAPGSVFSQDKLEWKAGPPELPRGAEVESHITAPDFVYRRYGGAAASTARAKEPA